MKRLLSCFSLLVVLLIPIETSAELSPKVKKELRDNYDMILLKQKGPFTINYCTCVNGELAPVADENMKVRPDPCGELEGVGQLFCSAYRNDLAKKLAEHGVYIANVFSNEVFLWDTHNDHHRLAKGFILEKYYMENNPESKITMSRAYGGISGSEFEVKYAPEFFAKYYALPNWRDFSNYLLQYELQRRFFCKCDTSLIKDIRNISLVIYRSYPPFKPVKDLIHNRLSPGLLPLVENFAKENPQDRKNKKNYELLIEFIKELTRVNQSQLAVYLPSITDEAIKQRIRNLIEIPEESPLILLDKLADLVVVCRNTVASKKISPKEAVELINLNVSSNLLIHIITAGLIDSGKEWKAGELLDILGDLIAGSYGAGLMSHREYDSAVSLLTELMEADDLTLGETYRVLNRANRVVEWAQASVKTSFWDVWEPWTYLFPSVQRIPDDIIRSSPLIDYAEILKTLREHLLSRLNLKHNILGQVHVEGVRALNPGLASGPLAFFADGQEYTRDNILALETTNAELEPVAGIITKDEGNVVSHVQLLARALGVPNAVFLDKHYRKLESLRGQSLFYAITPMGRVILKETEKMDEADRLILAEYEKNKKRTSDADVKGITSKLTIDADRLELDETDVLGLDKIRRKDSGKICGPKAAFLGELKHYFPENVARGVVIPFGVYESHFESAKVGLPEDLKNSGLAQPGLPLSKYVRETYNHFFEELLNNPDISSKQLAEWIKPRLDIIRHSISQISLDPDFIDDLQEKLSDEGLFDNGEMTRGVFVRSDTNVEDMPNFNGAGLNLTIFNLMSFNEVLEGIKKVWASPFTYRSFSWRQSIISDPNLVFPSIVILESIPSDKSGVLITADVETGDSSKMTIATAEGVGGTVDGSPAETLLYSQGNAKLMAQFKSPTRRMLILTGKGGSKMVPSTGSEVVLEESELKALVEAAAEIKDEFKPEKGLDGRPLPWDIEYGFSNGKLFLFQTRPFVGNSDLRNLPALAELDKGIKEKMAEPFSLDEMIRWHQ